MPHCLREPCLLLLALRRWRAICGRQGCATRRLFCTRSECTQNFTSRASGDVAQSPAMSGVACKPNGGQLSEAQTPAALREHVFMADSHLW
ncbi:hypothetical protein MTO96_020028 [Rhipicephalus appendiculatus]